MNETLTVVGDMLPGFSDAGYGNDQHYRTGVNNLEQLTSATKYGERVAVFKQVARYNHGKFASLSKRRKKILMAECQYFYDIHTGMLVHRNRRNERGVRSLSRITHTFVEKVHPAEQMFMDTWVKGLVGSK